jgi:hypothetical protein
VLRLVPSHTKNAILSERSLEPVYNHRYATIRLHKCEPRFELYVGDLWKLLVHGTDQLRLQIHKAVIAIRISRPLRTKTSAARITHRFPPLTDCKIFIPVDADEKRRLRQQVTGQRAAILRLI